MKNEGKKKCSPVSEHRLNRIDISSAIYQNPEFPQMKTFAGWS